MRLEVYVVCTLLCSILIGYAPPLLAGTITLSSGREMKARVVDADEESVTLSLPDGARIVLKRSRIALINGHNQWLGIYRRKFSAANTADEFADLGLWSREHGLERETMVCLQRAISLNPDHVQAREVLGYEKREGEWIQKAQEEGPEKPGSDVATEKQESNEVPETEPVDLPTADRTETADGTRSDAKRDAKLKKLRKRQEELLGDIWMHPQIRHTEHYHILTDCSPKTAEIVAMAMEALYSNMKKAFGFEGEASGVRVLVFKHQSDFIKYGSLYGAEPSQRIIGLYYSVSKEILALEQEDSSELTKLLLHEGTHQFVDLVLKVRPPVWVNEGIAVYFQESKWRGKKLRYGVVSKDRLKYLQNMIRYDTYTPLRELVSMSYEDGFGYPQYCEAWGLVHFFAKAGDGKHAWRFRKYFNLLKDGTNPDAAFHEAFGKDLGRGGYETLEKHWKRFVLNGMR